MSEVCSQHALCAYMWIILATEQCSSTWPVSWNIPLCDPCEASHPTVNPLPPSLSLDPEECPHGLTEQTTTPASFGFPAKKKKKKVPGSQTSPPTIGLCFSSFHSIWEDCVVSPLLLCNGDATWLQPPAIFKASCVLICYCLLQLPVCSVDTHWGSRMWMTFVTLPAEICLLKN